MIGFMLFAAAAAHSAPLHELIHPDAANLDHNCVITMLAQGQFYAPAGVFVVVGCAVFVGGLLRLPEILVTRPAEHGLPSGRAPPFFSVLP